MRALKILLVTLPIAFVLLSFGLTFASGGNSIPVQQRPHAWPIYPQGAPSLPGGAERENWFRLKDGVIAAYNVTEPTLEPFLPHPAVATGTAVVIAPGGASVTLAIDIEGWQVARWFADHGVAAFVLKYRTRPSPPNRYIRGLWSLSRLPFLYKTGKFSLSAYPPAVDDSKAAIRILRERSSEFGIDPSRVGFIGFSAGAITTLALVQQADEQARPSFAAMIYGPLDTATPPLNPPPLFLAIAADDYFARNTDHGLARAWKQAGAPVEFHEYSSGGHGFGLGRPGTDTVRWPFQFIAWLQAQHLLAAQPGSGNQPLVAP